MNPGSGTVSNNEKYISSQLKKWTSFDIADFNSDGRLDVLGLSEDEGRTAWFDPTKPLSSNLRPIYSDVLGASSADAAILTMMEIWISYPLTGQMKHFCGLKIWTVKERI